MPNLKSPSPIIWFLVGGLPGLVAWWLLFQATAPARRALLTAAGVLAGGLILATAAGYAAAQADPPAPGETSLLPGAVFLAGLAGGIALAAVAGLWAWRRARREPPSPQQQEPGRDAPAPTSPQQDQDHGQAAASQQDQGHGQAATRPPRVVVVGCSPQEANSLEQALQAVADTLGRSLLVFVHPRGQMAAIPYGEVIAVRVRQPELHPITQAIFASLNGAQVQRPLERQRLPNASPASPRRLRHDDLAAAVGEAKASKGEG